MRESFAGALPRTPGFFEGISRMSDIWQLKRPLTTIIVRGLMHYRRTVGLAIPCQVASPQSLTPFHQATITLDSRSEDRNHSSDAGVMPEKSSFLLEGQTNISYEI
jgi:hypothetical protein